MKFCFKYYLFLVLLLLIAPLIDPLSASANTIDFVNSGDLFPSVWDPVDLKWENGNPQGYTDGQTVAMVLEVKETTLDQKQFDLCLQVVETMMGSNYYAFTLFEHWNVTHFPPHLPDNSPPTFNSTISFITAKNANLVSVSTPVIGGGQCDPEYLHSRVVFTMIDTSKSAFFTYGGRLAKEGEPLPAGVSDTTVPSGHSASFILGTFQSRVEGAGDKTINFKGGDISLIPGINLHKTVAPVDGVCGVDDVEILTIQAGDSVRFCFEILNTGEAPLLDVMLNDLTFDVDLTSSLVGLTDLDSDNNADDLAPGSSATAELVRVIDAETTNTAEATAQGLTASDPSTVHVFFCGDGNVDPGEACDDGNADNTDNCTNTCEFPRCGDGFTQGNEACDDGNTDNTDNCTNACELAKCGDGFTQGNEACDDGNLDNTDECTNACELPRCGDGFTQGNEACDDGNTDNTDNCTNACELAKCGDGFTQANEACDDGNLDNTDECTNACELPRCGDGFTQGGETCDDGNTDNTDNCTNACELAKCGDGFTQANEACDDGNLDNTDECTNACELPRCGDGFTQGNEACDDGNTDNTDDCTDTCELAKCGDGFTQGNETCDDGNTDNTDNCTNACELAKCGDGFTQANEACDDENLDNTDECTNACELPRCGDGFTQDIEECDDGNADNTDDCTETCELPKCGDGFIQTKEECDDGNTDDFDGCSNQCLEIAYCGECASKEELKSPIRIPWNSYLNQINISSVVNTCNSPEQVRLSLFNTKGQLESNLEIEIPGKVQRDLIVNEMKGFKKDSYGLVEIAFNTPGCIDGHIYYYKTSTNSNPINPELDYSIGVKFENPSKGTTYGLFNTMQPSCNLNELKNAVYNWVQVINLDPVNSKGFTKNIYNMNGILAQSEHFTLPPRGRLDSQAGHEKPGPNELGLVEIVPDDPDCEYISTVNIYGTNASTGTIPSGFEFGRASRTKTPSDSCETLTVTSEEFSDNWAIIANPTQFSASTQMTLEDHHGTLGGIISNVSIEPFGQRHFYVSGQLDKNTSGVLEVCPAAGRKIIADSTFYFRGNDGCKVEAAYSSPARDGTCGTLYGSYNSYWDQINILRISGTSDLCLSDAFIRVYDINGTRLSDFPVWLSASMGLDFNLNEPPFDVENNSYGLIEIVQHPNARGAVIADLIRVRPNGFGKFNIGTGLPVR